MENELYHHGILGMRWGVRRFQNPDGSLTPAGKKRYPLSEDRKRYLELKSKGLDALSTEEIKEINARDTVEKRYNELNPSSYKKAMQIIGTTTASITAVAGLVKVVKPIMDKIIKSVDNQPATKKAAETVTKKAAETVAKGATKKAAETMATKTAEKVTETALTTIVDKAASSGTQSMGEFITEYLL